jgi:hypothetical protein
MLPLTLKSSKAINGAPEIGQWLHNHCNGYAFNRTTVVELN